MRRPLLAVVDAAVVLSLICVPAPGAGAEPGGTARARKRPRPAAPSGVSSGQQVAVERATESVAEIMRREESLRLLPLEPAHLAGARCVACGKPAAHLATFALAY